MAEIDANVVQVQLSPQHPRALLEQAVEEAQKDPASRIASPSRWTGEDEPAWFDPHLLGRVLRHLLENAARHTPPGTRVCSRAGEPTTALEFSVEDNGPGIDALDLPLIFEKFYRGKRGTQSTKDRGWAWPSRARF